MNAKEFVMDIFERRGRADALALRYEADALTGTEIIDRETAVPAFDPGKDYTPWPRMSPVADEGQVWLLLQPYNSANHPGRPSHLRAMWGLAHTTNPAKAKPWVDPFGTSGLYMTGECYKKPDGTVWRCKGLNVDHDADALPDAWEEVAL